MSSLLKLGYSIMILQRLHHSLSLHIHLLTIHVPQEYTLIANKTIPLQSCELSIFTIKNKLQLIIKMIALYRSPSSNFDTFIEDFKFIISLLIDISTIETGFQYTHEQIK